MMRICIASVLFMSSFFAGHVSAASTLEELAPELFPYINYYDKDYFHECVLSATKSGLDGKAMAAIERACTHKATPKKCRGKPSAACLEECKQEGYWSNKMGDCAKG